MKIFLSLLLSALAFSHLQAQTYCFDGSDKKAISVSSSDVYTPDRGYGFDFQNVIDEARKQQNDTFRLSDGIFYFSVSLCFTKTQIVTLKSLIAFPYSAINLYQYYYSNSLLYLFISTNNLNS